MSIFSLQTKKHLVGWSIILSFFANIIASILAVRFLKDNIDSVFTRCDIVKTNFVVVVIKPLKLIFICANSNSDLVLLILRNIFYWTLPILIILSLIRYFKNNQEVKNK
jgi:hypothetical protein